MLLVHRALLFVIPLVMSVNGEIPSYIKVCKATEKDLSSCIKESVTQILPSLAAGLPEIGVPPCEPFDVGTLEITSGLNINLTNLKLHGFLRPTIEEFSANYDKFQFAMVVLFKDISFTADYTIDTKLLTIPVQGNGPTKGTIGSLHFLGKLKGHKIDINGNDHLRLEFTEFKIVQPKNVKIYLYNLFPENAQLKDAASKVVTDSSDVLFEEFIPFLEVKIKKQITDISNAIAAKYTVDELFPMN